MSRYYLLIFHFLLHNDIGHTVRIIGLYPEEQASDKANLKFVSHTHWTTQCLGMSIAAMRLAEKYNLTYLGKPIEFTPHRTKSSANGFKEFDLVCNLITNDSNRDTLGIVGPSSSSTARLLSMLAAQINMPLISYGATNHDLSDSEIYQTFYRIAPSDSLLAKAIIQLFEFFSWKTCTLIIGNDDFGYGGLKILTEDYHSNITFRARIIFDPPRDKFHVDLAKTIAQSSTRIILVWANQSASSRIIQHALDEGLLGKEYVWIVTSQIHPQEYDEQYQTALEGLLMIMPIIVDKKKFGVDEELQKEAVDVFNEVMGYPENEWKDLTRISPFAIYSFDATWMLLKALSQLTNADPLPKMTKTACCFDSVIDNSIKYLHHLKETNFSGISGTVQFDKNTSNNRKEGVHYGLYNLQRRSSVTLHVSELKMIQSMIWCQIDDRWNNNLDDTKRRIVWPNQVIGRVPTDYLQLAGKELRIRVIEAPPFVMVRHGAMENTSHPMTSKLHQNNICFSRDFETNTPGVFIYGFIADFINVLQSEMGFIPTIDLADSNTSYHDMALSVSGDSPKYQMAMSDIRMTANRLQTVDFSTSIHENNFRIMIRQSPLAFSSDIFSCFNPFSWDVWLIIGIILIYSSIIILIFERKNLRLNDDSSKIRIYVIEMTKILSSVVIKTGDTSIRTHSSRLTVVALYGLGIILVAIYTANLSSVLTLRRNQPTISGIDDIKNGIIPFGRVGVINNSAASDYYEQDVSTKFYPLSSAQEMYARLLDHTIDAAIWDATVLEYAADNDYCGQLVPVGVGFVRSSYAIAIPKNWPYKLDLDTSILQIREKQVFECLENRWFNSRKCSELSDSTIDSLVRKTETFSLSTISGVFLSFFIATAIAVLLHVFPLIKFRIMRKLNVNRSNVRLAPSNTDLDT